MEKLPTRVKKHKLGNRLLRSLKQPSQSESSQAWGRRTTEKGSRPYEKAVEIEGLKKKIRMWSVIHVFKEANSFADSLAKSSIDRGQLF
ncbi:hypothetical protein COLO4_29147 [Corchorus olitorius]|uniref:RNase H type-1 domain-containing protein n=1 Tax=Corchorus olitorius TaxID=93759 RepID=A0A1R3HG66_9ROSI|nr:hypothetical protein COLO4_29147 [Corchorus olitorius]